ncbi:hypothetical protein ACX27_26630 [Nostoc piscinale CENA21]|uniref:Uncharacterized protein n=1 Tax=Nostoc piscinale CENA21 TaxID=224013 RepID=A0A0M5MHL6_9NOSO|nr:hypothetical protein [Nostoc piscinale]ALF55605.1 hypothetical protein ACX27_26630 [Nostoc piscinale CENA21]
MEELNIQKSITIPPESQQRIIDQVLIQSGGVGLGILVTFVAVFTMAYWMGLREAIIGWTDKQKVESEALRNLSTAFSIFLAEYKEDTRAMKSKLQEIYDKPTNSGINKR